MRKDLLVSVLLAGGLLVFATFANAYTNINAKAQVNWGNDVDTLEDDLETMPTSTQYVYVQLYDLVQIAGCEFKLEWYPAGALGTGCYEFSLGNHPAGTGTDCTWVMRGTMIEGWYENGDDWFGIAFASDLCNSACTKGNVARVMLDFSGCGQDVNGYVQIDYLKLSDCAAVVDILTTANLGEPVTVLGGTPVDPITWGRVKSLYR